jgi:hypothetical protein
VGAAHTAFGRGFLVLLYSHDALLNIMKQNPTRSSCEFMK